MIQSRFRASVARFESETNNDQSGANILRLIEEEVTVNTNKYLHVPVVPRNIGKIHCTCKYIILHKRGEGERERERERDSITFTLHVCIIFIYLAHPPRSNIISRRK